MDMISVVIPAHNCADTIGETVESVLSQECDSEVEVVIVNDGSTDTTCDIVEEIARGKPNVAVRHLDKASGRPSVPRNIGMDLAKGDFVCFMDADDIMPPGYLAVARKAIRADNEFCGSLKYPFRNNVPAPAGLLSGAFCISIPRIVLYSKNVFTTSGLMLPRQLVGSMRFENIFLEDWRFLIRLCRRGARGRLLLSPRVFYRIHSASLTPKRKHIQVKRVFTVLRGEYGLLLSIPLFFGYFLVGLMKIVMESGIVLRLTQRTVL